MVSQRARAYQPLIFWRGADPGNCSYNNLFPLGWWRVLSESCTWTLDRVEPVDAMFLARKSPGKTPLKSTKFISNDYCKICRIRLKISGRCKINIFARMKDNEENVGLIKLTILEQHELHAQRLQRFCLDKHHYGAWFSTSRFVGRTSDFRIQRNKLLWADCSRPRLHCSSWPLKWHGFEVPGYESPQRLQWTHIFADIWEQLKNNWFSMHSMYSIAGWQYAEHVLGDLLPRATLSSDVLWERRSSTEIKISSTSLSETQSISSTGESWTSTNWEEDG